jgi:methylase of polypeptide subunit release factors
VEARLVPENRRDIFEKFGDAIFPLRGPRSPHYGGTPIQSLLDHLDKLSLPSQHHFADLGAGLGAACFAAAAKFDQVTGFETQKRIRTEAETLRKMYGINHVRFINQDFMEEEASLRSFNVIYFFKPFSENFFVRIREKLLETEPGTVIISRRFMGRELYDKFNFDFLPPLDNWMSTAEQPYLPQADFYTFIRK